MTKINELNDAWVEAGQAVSDLNAKLNAAVLDDNFDQDKFAALKTERDNKVAQRDALKDQLATARAAEVVNMNQADKKPLNEAEKDMKATFVADLKNLVRGRYDAISSVTTDTNGNGGLTIPEDVQTAIHELVRQFATLQNLVTVESVGTNKGSRDYETLSEIKRMAEVEEGAEIQEGDYPKLSLIKYVIKDYAGYFVLTNDLLADTAEAMLAWLNKWIAKKVAVTRNTAIIAKLGTATKKPTITKFDDIKDMVLTGVDPAIAPTSSFLTNQSGFAVLAKVKDAMGNYLVQRDVTQPDRYLLDGKLVTVIADRWLPDVSGSHPLYFGDYKQAITLFDRQSMSLMTTNVGGQAWRTNTTEVRVIDRFDVQATDADAIEAGSFKAVADQPANFAASPKAQPGGELIGG